VGERRVERRIAHRTVGQRRELRAQPERGKDEALTAAQANRSQNAREKGRPTFCGEASSSNDRSPTR
jgi:hypothetical protein